MPGALDQCNPGYRNEEGGQDAALSTSALLEDVKIIYTQVLSTNNVDESIKYYAEMIIFMEEIVATGQDIVEIIDSRYSRSF